MAKKKVEVFLDKVEERISELEAEKDYINNQGYALGTHLAEMAKIDLKIEEAREIQSRLFTSDAEHENEKQAEQAEKNSNE